MPDDSTKISNIHPPAGGPVSNSQSDQGQVPPVVQQPSDQTQPTVQATPQVPVVTVPAGKENAPIAISKPQEQWIEETAPEARVVSEVQEAGVKAIKNETLHVPKEVAQAGVAPTGMAVPLPEEPHITLPMTEERAEKILSEHGKVKLSVAWMAMIVLRQLKILRFNTTKKEAKAV